MCSCGVLRDLPFVSLCVGADREGECGGNWGSSAEHPSRRRRRWDGHTSPELFFATPASPLSAVTVRTALESPAAGAAGSPESASGCTAELRTPDSDATAPPAYAVVCRLPATVEAAEKNILRKVYAPQWPNSLPLPPWWDSERADVAAMHPPPRQPPAPVEVDPDRLGALRMTLTAAAFEMGMAAPGTAEMVRYLKARKMDVEAAYQSLLATLQWRSQRPPRGTPCPVCDSGIKQHCMQLIGWDLQCRPVLFSSYRHNNDREVETQLEHALLTLEGACAVMPDGVTQLVHVVSFDGFSAADLSPVLAQRLARTVQAHFPERLGCVLLIDPPAAFRWLLAALKSIVSERTMSKVKAVTLTGADDQELAEVLPPEMMSWLREVS